MATLLFDLDGVFRSFDARRAQRLASGVGRPVEDLYSAAFSAERLRLLVTGRLSRRAWVEQVGHALNDAALAADWLSDIGVLDEAMLALADKLRAAGNTVALLTNGTDTTRDELRRLGGLGRFDRVFVSAELGLAKPDPEAFRAAARALGQPVQAVCFVDDARENVAAASSVGMRAHRFAGRAPLEVWLAEVLGTGL